MEKLFFTPRAYESIKAETNLEKQRAIDSLNRYPLTQFIPLRKNRQRKYICPLCGSGENKNNTSAFLIRRNNRVICYSCQGFGSSKAIGTDTLGAICIIEGITPEIALKKYIGFDWHETFNRIADEHNSGKKTERQYRPTGASGDLPPLEEREKLPEVLPDITEEIKKWKSYLQGNEKAKNYLKSRGLSPETIEAYNLGYDNDGHITIPFNQHYFIKRTIWTNENGLKYNNAPSEIYGRMPLFGEEHLLKGEPLFIVEGTFDAMSIYQSGGLAIALCTTGRPSSLIYTLEKIPKDNLPRFIVALDKDEAKADGRRPGQDGQKILCEYLTEIGATFIEYDISTPFKDANEMLINSPELLKTRIADALKEVKR